MRIKANMYIKNSNCFWVIKLQATNKYKYAKPLLKIAQKNKS